MLMNTRPPPFGPPQTKNRPPTKKITAPHPYERKKKRTDNSPKTPGPLPLVFDPPRRRPPPRNTTATDRKAPRGPVEPRAGPRDLYPGKKSKPLSNPKTRGKVLARAASCFEIAHDSRISARFYEEAAQEVSSSSSNPQLAAELFNRAALQFRESSEFFFAGSAWVRAAEEFGKIQAGIINCGRNLVPLPISALKSHLCGNCFEAAADVYARAAGNEMWSAGTYWRAGKVYSEGPPNIQAFDAYRRSLIANIRYYGTLEPEKLRRSLPMSEEERASKVNPIEVMEDALARCNNYHQQNQATRPSRCFKHIARWPQLFMNSHWAFSQLQTHMKLACFVPHKTNVSEEYTFYSAITLRRYSIGYGRSRPTMARASVGG